MNGIDDTRVEELRSITKRSGKAMQAKRCTAFGRSIPWVRATGRTYRASPVLVIVRKVEAA
jgi:hypothetical protein